jgi:hypothetical protein
LRDQVPKLSQNGKLNEFFQLLVKDLSVDSGKHFGTSNGKLYELENWQQAFTDYKNGNAKKLLFKLN